MAIGGSTPCIVLISPFILFSDPVVLVDIHGWWNFQQHASRLSRSDNNRVAVQWWSWHLPSWPTRGLGHVSKYIWDKCTHDARECVPDEVCSVPARSLGSGTYLPRWLSWLLAFSRAKRCVSLVFTIKYLASGTKHCFSLCGFCSVIELYSLFPGMLSCELLHSSCNITVLIFCSLSLYFRMDGDGRSCAANLHTWIPSTTDRHWQNSFTRYSLSTCSCSTGILQWR